MNGSEYSGPSTALGGTDLTLDGVTDTDTISNPSNGQTISQASPSAPAYQQLCSDTGGECHFVRFQF